MHSQRVLQNACRVVLYREQRTALRWWAQGFCGRRVGLDKLVLRAVYRKRLIAAFNGCVTRNAESSNPLCAFALRLRFAPFALRLRFAPSPRAFALRLALALHPPPHTCMRAKRSSILL